MCVIPPDGAVRIWACADRFPDGLLHAFHVSPGHALLKVLRVIVVSVREQCDQRHNTKAHTIADDENDAHLANDQRSYAGPMMSSTPQDGLSALAGAS